MQFSLDHLCSSGATLPSISECLQAAKMAFELWISTGKSRKEGSPGRVKTWS